MNFKIKSVKSILLTGCFIFFLQTLNAQKWEAGIVRNINPVNPNSGWWKAVSKTAKPISIAAPAGLLAAGLINKDKIMVRQSIETFGALAISIVATEALKITINRQRPYQKFTGIFPDQFENGKSFPSGHTSVTFATATSLALQYKKWYVVAPAFAWAATVGYSRMYFGQHYPTDIAGAAVVGAGSAFLAHQTNKWLQKRQEKKQSKPAL